MSQTPKDQVRLLISDVGGADGASFLYKDSEINTFLEQRGDSVNLAAATALRAIAGNEAQVSKRIKFLELQTDGPAVAKELRELADQLEKTEAENTNFDIIEVGWTPANRRDLRGLGF